MESLLLDPFYIPLVGPRYDVEAKLKTDIEIKLIEITKNKLANELLSLRIEEGNNLLKEDLKFSLCNIKSTYHLHQQNGIFSSRQTIPSMMQVLYSESCTSYLLFSPKSL